MNLSEFRAEILAGQSWWHRVAVESWACGRLQLIGDESDIYIARFFLHHTETDPETKKLLSANSCFLHRIMRPDASEHLHNHPWNFQTRILSGGYVEHRRDGQSYFGANQNLSRSAETFHHIASVDLDTWTLVTTGPRINDWGFLVDGVLVPWREYLRVSPTPADSTQESKS